MQRLMSSMSGQLTGQEQGGYRMKFRVERDVFAEAVAWAARSLPVRPPVPVLAGLLLEVSESPAALALSSFDYEVSANAQIEISGAEDGPSLGVWAAPRGDQP